MALNALNIEMITRLRNEGHFVGTKAIAELGTQEISNEMLEPGRLDEICEAFGASKRNFLDPSPVEFGYMRPHDHKKTVDTRELWEWLGFSHTRITTEDGQNVVPLDLNFDNVPQAMRNTFALVTNIGTTAHFANQIGAFKVVHDLCDKGGIMLHYLPSEGFVTHGLVKYDPKFFWMLARSNGYRWLHWDLNIATSRKKIHKDVVTELKRFNSDAESRTEAYRVSDGNLFVVFQKLYDIEFVPPLDVPNGTVPSQQMSERYWTVFQPQRFQEIVEKEDRGNPTEPSD